MIVAMNQLCDRVLLSLLLRSVYHAEVPSHFQMAMFLGSR